MSFVWSDLICIPLQRMVFKATKTPLPINSFQPRAEATDTVLSDGIRRVTEVSYESQYPNGYMDIYYSPAKGIHPTVFYWHGGGFLFGDKASGDPLAAETGNEVSYVPELARRGFNVVNLNYALAPRYRHPVQVRQMNEALTFCLKHAEELELDMERVFLGGGSAGADMSEIYGMAMVDADYAAKLGFTPVLTMDRLCGLIIDEAALTYLNYNSKRMDAMIKSWVGCNDFRRSENAKTLDVPKFIKDGYPPCYIIASNEDPQVFKESSEDLIRELQRLGVDYDYYYQLPEADKLEHGFTNRYATNRYARESLERMLAFMARHTKE